MFACYAVELAQQSSPPILSNLSFPSFTRRGFNSCTTPQYPVALPDKFLPATSLLPCVFSPFSKFPLGCRPLSPYVFYSFFFACTSLNPTSIRVCNCCCVYSVIVLKINSKESKANVRFREALNFRAPISKVYLLRTPYSMFITRTHPHPSFLQAICPTNFDFDAPERPT